jgi:hypothetical protein
MAYSSVCVIGLGTLGSFVANSLVDIETIRKIILVDHDVVEQKNFLNSIYRQIDIKSFKAEALTDILSSKNNNCEIIPITKKFIEGKTKIPKCNLILDCRDVSYNRLGSIDARLYISSRYLIVDCRKYVKYKTQHEGKYLITLNKDDLKYAGAIVFRLISTNALKQMIKSEIVQKFDLDFSKTLIHNNTIDFLYDDDFDDVEFVNLPETLDPIKKFNKSNELNVVVGSKEYPLTQAILPQKTINSNKDLMESFKSITKSMQNEFNTYIIYLHKEDKNITVELVPETGAA